MRLSRVLGGALAASLSIAFLVGGAARAQSGGNFFGFNFWPSQPQTYSAPVNAAYPPFRQYAHRRVHAKTHRHHYARKTPPNPLAQNNDPTTVEWSLLAKRLAVMQKANPGALNVFLNDDTLQRKDAVMTSAGIFVFNGSSSSFHTSQDFTPLAYAKTLPHKVELAAIERVSVPHFEVAQAAKPAKTRVFVDVRPTIKSFEPVESKAVRHIAGVHWFE
jgi:hypothetical protein